MREIRITHAGWDDQALAGEHDTSFVIIGARDVIPLLRWAIAHPEQVEGFVSDLDDEPGDVWLRDAVMQTIIRDDGTEPEMTADGPCMTADAQWSLTERTVIPWEQAILWYCRALMYGADMNATDGELHQSADDWIGKVSSLTFTTREDRDRW
jgi:hypothetical protein